MADGERSPLLDELPDGSYGSSAGIVSGDPSGPQPTTDSEFLPSCVAPDEPPPPYSPLGSPLSSITPVICCRVCQSNISVVGRTHQHVVKCGVCNETTPIKNPPPGKKYVRCLCNCLLICKATSQLVACPRPHCKRIINLGAICVAGGSPAPHRQPFPDFIRVFCGHCFRTFLWQESCVLVRCPHCRKVSCVDRQYARRRGWLRFLIFVVHLAITLGVVIGTWNLAQTHQAVYASWALFFLVTIFAMKTTISWCCVRISHPISRIT